MESELRQLERKKTEFESEAREESASQGRSVQLEDDQMEMYQNLKDLATKESSR